MWDFRGLVVRVVVRYVHRVETFVRAKTIRVERPRHRDNVCDTACGLDGSNDFRHIGWLAVGPGDIAAAPERRGHVNNQPTAARSRPIPDQVIGNGRSGIADD